MTTDSSATPPPETPGGATPGGSGAPPHARRKRGLWKALAWAIGVPVLVVALVGGALYGAVATERGTAYAWQAAVKLLGGRLSGTLEGGALATGLRLRQVEWRSFDGSGTDIKVDKVDGRWVVSGR